MLKLVFKYKCKPSEFISSLSARTINHKSIYGNGRLIFHHRKQKLVLRKQKRTYQHALQRNFVGKITYDNDITVLTGNFKYPCLSTIIFIVFFIVLLYGNLSMYNKVVDINARILCTCIFGFMYVSIILFFITGIYMFKSEEKEVISILKESCQGDGSLDNQQTERKSVSRTVPLTRPTVPLTYNKGMYDENQTSLSSYIGYTSGIFPKETMKKLSNKFYNNNWNYNDYIKTINDQLWEARHGKNKSKNRAEDLEKLYVKF